MQCKKAVAALLVGALGIVAGCARVDPMGEYVVIQSPSVPAGSLRPYVVAQIPVTRGYISIETSINGERRGGATCVRAQQSCAGTLSAEERVRFQHAVERMHGLPGVRQRWWTCSGGRGLPLYLYLYEASGDARSWELCETVDIDGRRGYPREFEEVLDAVGGGESVRQRAVE